MTSPQKVVVSLFDNMRQQFLEIPFTSRSPSLPNPLEPRTTKTTVPYRRALTSERIDHGFTLLQLVFHPAYNAETLGVTPDRNNKPGVVFLTNQLQKYTRLKTGEARMLFLQQVKVIPPPS